MWIICPPGIRFHIKQLQRLLFYTLTLEKVNRPSIWVQIYHVCLSYNSLYSDPRLTVLLHLPDAAEAERLVLRNETPAGLCL